MNYQAITEAGKTAFFETKLEASAWLEEYLFCGEPIELDRDGPVFWVMYGGPVCLRHNQHSEADYTLKKWRGQYYWTCDPGEYGVKTYKLCWEL